MNNPKQFRRENAIIRGLDGLTIEDMKAGAMLHRQGIDPCQEPATTARERRVRRAYTILAAINKLPGQNWFGISIDNPTNIPETPRKETA